MQNCSQSPGPGAARRGVSPVRLVCVPAIIAGAVFGVAGSADSKPPASSKPVPVTAGAATRNVDAALTEAASIAGHVTSASTHKPIGSALVLAFDSAGHSAGLPVMTGPDGSYQLKALRASSTGYAVCINAYSATGGGVTSGYLNRCYKTAAWNGGAVPKGVTRVGVAAGQDVTGINVALPSGAAISGKLTSTAGAALDSVYVQLRNRATGARFFALTGKSGAYVAKSLTPSSTGYQVCFDGRGSTTASPRGFLAQCFKNVSWTGGTMPSKATAVSVSAGKTHTGINGRLAGGGAVAGRVTDSRSGAAVPHATVSVRSSSGAVLGSTQTDSKGRYTVKGLWSSSSDRVCVSPARISATTTYGGRCYKNVAWTGGKLPKGTTAVSVKVGRTTANVNLRPVRSTVVLGSIAGTITEKAGGQPLQYATVHVFTTSGVDAGSETTDAAGHYKVTGLRPSSTGYVVCSEPPLFSITTPMPEMGWAPRCFADVAWTGGSIPAAAKRLALAAGQNRTGVDIALQPGGGISGTVTAAGAGTAVSSIVSVYTPDGHLVATGFSSPSDGSYAVNNLGPLSPGYVVCFDGRFTGGNKAYLPECYDNQPWSGN